MTELLSILYKLRIFTSDELSDTDRIEIVKYRIEKAYRTYQEAVGSIKNGYVETAANR